jgi:PIN domain nuclease of toxin-antitoxin system
VGRSVLILLDTHAVIWLSRDHHRISSKAREAIQEARKKERGLAISGITLLEIARLSSHGRIHLTPDLESFLSDVELHFTVLPITANIARQAFELPESYPNDPVDRVIGATALVHDIFLITADRQIHKSRAVPTIW